MVRKTAKFETEFQNRAPPYLFTRDELLLIVSSAKHPKPNQGFDRETWHGSRRPGRWVLDQVLDWVGFVPCR